MAHGLTGLHRQLLHRPKAMSVMRKTPLFAFPVLMVLIFTACRHSQGATPIATANAPVALGTAPVTGSLDIDVGVADVRLLIDEPQPISVSNVESRDLRDSVAYAFETKPAGCAEPNVAPGRIGVGRRDRDCYVRWEIRIPRIADVRVRVSVGRVELVAPADRAIRLHAGVGSVKIRLDGREFRHGKSPGAGDELGLGDIDTLPRLDVSTGVGSIRAELNTRPNTQRER